MHKWEVREADVALALSVYSQLAEFSATLAPGTVASRLAGKTSLVIVAFAAAQPIGFKIGYDRFCDGSFYSWLGGVVATHRQKGVASELNGFMENWASRAGFSSICFKTRNRFAPMLISGLQWGYHVEAVEKRQNLAPADYRIWMRKSLV